MNYHQLFISKQQDSRLNTSYPLSPSDWAPYRVANQTLDFSRERELSMYIHIPFCQQLCSFCEYTRMICPTEEEQMIYLSTLEQDIRQFLETNSFSLRGFDIGGGTPTCLSDRAFQYLMSIYQHVCESVPRTPDFEPSIESTFQTCTASKLSAIVSAGIRRLSLGLQSTDARMLHACSRATSSVEHMKTKMQLAYEAGIHKINLDLMYGLPHQSLESIHSDLQIIRALDPEQVTVYELRTNQLNSAVSQSPEFLYDCYCLLYDSLTQMGYHAHFGQNTFSKDPDDYGVSSYLRSRMLEATAYKGFGISAQSMCSQGVSYNVGKNAAALRALIASPTYDHSDTYLLPASEIANKYIAIAGYCNSYSLSILCRCLDDTDWSALQERIHFLLDQGYVSLHNDILHITRAGFMYYGAINDMLRTTKL